MGSTRLSLGESGGDLVEVGDRAMGWVASAADSRYMESGLGDGAVCSVGRQDG